MLRHYAYFEVLASLEESSPGWTPTLAGLGVLNLVDAVREDHSIVDEDWTGVRSVVECVASLREGNPLRRPLSRVLDELRGEGPDWNAVNENLFAYGRALDFDGHWKLAVDVFATVADIARADRVPELAIEATTALGGAARRSGDWDQSAEGYAVAAHLANALGDKSSGLTVRVGTANTQIARGNIPAAKAILDEVIAEAQAAGLDGVGALALHSRASVAHLQGEYSKAVTLAYDALEKTTNPNVKDQITADIAAAFQELGMHDAARDAHMVVSLTSRYQWIRWQSTINLMELAIDDGLEQLFEEYGRELRNAALDPRLRSYFLLYYGKGARRFGREAEGLKFIGEARDFASAHKINQVAFEAEQALSAVGERQARSDAPVTTWSDDVSSEVRHVAEAFAQLREAALSSPSAEEWI